MADRGAQEGNTNATKGMDWRDAIRYELARIGREIDGDDPAYKKGLRDCAKQFIKAARIGEMWAIRELGDRTDGKSTQALEVSGPDREPLQAQLNYIPICPPDK